ncbi:MAG: hypothetical protein AB1Z57_07580 [Acidimicrobiia bacterium]
MSDSSHGLARRPGVVTFIGVILWIQAALAGVAAVAVFAFRNDADFQAATGQSADALLGLAIAEVIVALLLAWVASAIMRGSRGVRMLVGVVMGLRIASSLWFMITHHQGGFLYSGIANIAIALFVLWALFGNERSDEWFETTG